MEDNLGRVAARRRDPDGWYGRNRRRRPDGGGWGKARVEMPHPPPTAPAIYRAPTGRGGNLRFRGLRMGFYHAPQKFLQAGHFYGIWSRSVFSARNGKTAVILQF